MGGIFIKKFISDIFNKGNFKDYFNRNKVFLIVSVLVILLSVLSGIYDSAHYMFLMDSSISQLITASYSTQNVFSTYFVGNLINSLYMIVMGITFSIFAVLQAVSSSVTIGFLFEQNLISLALSNVFIILSYIFTICGALLVTKMEIRFIAFIFNHKNNKLSKLKVPLKDLILTITFIIVLLFIASVFKLLMI